MEHFDTFDYYKKMREDHVILAFNGIVSQEILTDIGASLKNKTSDNVNVSRKMFAIFIELAQNIHHHSAEKVFSETEFRAVGAGIIIVREDTGHYVLTSGNAATIASAAAIKERCDFINSLEKEDLKTYYKEQRKKPQRTNSPGANIGFIDMVRKSGNPIEVAVRPMDDRISFVTISVSIDKAF
jgi:hypothetical protein